jgi:hypothetical protein
MKATLQGCIISFLMCGIFIQFAGAKIPDSSSFAPLRLAALNVAGWTEQREQYKFFNVKDYYTIIDGGAADHDKQGLKGGIGIVLAGEGKKSNEIFFEDFAKASRASGMVDVKKKTLSTPKDFSETKLSAAVYDEVIGGCFVCFAKGKYYVEMSLTGYDSTEKALADAMLFITSICSVIPEK